MTLRTSRWIALLLALLLPVTGLVADETSVLVSILVRKGILTQEEAEAVLSEASQLNAQASPGVAPVSDTTVVSTTATTTAGSVSSAALAPAPEPEKKKKEPVYLTAASKIATGFKFGGRLQVQYAGLTTDIDNSEEQPDPTRHFFLRRVYIGAAVSFGEQWSSKVTFDVANQSFDAAYVRFAANESNAFDFGLRKVNMGYEETTSSGSLPAIERSGPTRYMVELNNGRRLGAGSYRIGAFYDGSSGNLFYGAALTNPERPNNALGAAEDGAVFNNGLAAWANVGYRLKYEGGNAIFGASFGYMQDQGGIVGMGQDLTIGDLYADASFGSFRLVAELLAADTGDANPYGFYVEPIYSFTPTIEGVVRFSYTDTDGRGIRMSDGVRSAPSGGTMDKLYEGYFGANWFIMGNDLKLQGGLVLGRTVDKVDGGEAEANTVGFRSQLQVNF